MKEIFQKLNKHEEQEITETTLLTNPTHYIGGSIAKHHRLFLFTAHQIEFLYIDFKPIEIENQKIYIIPAGHTLYLPSIHTDFYCLNITTSSLNDIEKLWLFRQKYQDSKPLACPLDIFNSTTYNNILSKLFDSTLFLNQNTFSTQYIYQAETLNTLFLNLNICHQLSVPELAEKLNISSKTLLRICNTVFQEKPQHIIRYHLVVKAVLSIIQNKTDSLSIISESLHFADLSTFTKYVKAFTGLTPTEIRNLHTRIHL